MLCEIDDPLFVSCGYGNCYVSAFSLPKGRRLSWKRKNLLTEGGYGLSCLNPEERIFAMIGADTGGRDSRWVVFQVSEKDKEEREKLRKSGKTPRISKLSILASSPSQKSFNTSCSFRDNVLAVTYLEFLQLWDFGDLMTPISLQNAPQKPCVNMKTTDHHKNVQNVCFLGSKRSLASCCMSGKIIHWDFHRTLHPVHAIETKSFTYPTHCVYKLRFDERSNLLFSAHEKGMIMAHDLRTYNCVRTFKNPRLKKRVRSICLDDTNLYGGDFNGYIFCYDLKQEGKERWMKKVHRKRIFQLRRMKGERNSTKIICSCSGDKHVAVIDGETGNIINKMKEKSSLSDICVVGRRDLREKEWMMDVRERFEFLKDTMTDENEGMKKFVVKLKKGSWKWFRVFLE